ncbi:YceH family protein [Lentisalinibacter orientalis]|uniref:YceH family protein n=1 Tax=Lentisalinibacter orientalis TaxID=2992241 RepID=UPI0038690360
MEALFDTVEARVIGALIEKEITTPDHYPLSLNALTNACNQKSNRDPVMNLTETEVQEALDSLHRKHLVLDRSGFGSRVVKFKQRFCNTEFSDLHFTPGETAIVCLLLLRGPQTPGELRSRSGRLHTFSSLGEVQQCLESLAGREEGPLVTTLPREPGRREIRWAHLFCGEPVSAGTAAPVDAPAPATKKADATLERIEALEKQVADLVERLTRLEGRGREE